MYKLAVVFSACATIWSASTAHAQSCDRFSIAVLGDTRDGFAGGFTRNLQSIDQMDPRPIGLFNSGDITPDGELNQWMSHHQTLVDAVVDPSVAADANGIPRESAFATESTGVVWDPGGRIRYVPIMGNHDWHNGLMSSTNLNAFFPWLSDLDASTVGRNGPSGLYYYVTFENAVFIILDSEHPSAAQSAWLESVLQKPELEARWKLVFFHHPPFPCGGGKSPFSGGLPWVRLFETYQVDLVLLGHTHTTERTCRMIDGICVPDAEFGVMYLNSSGGGVTPRQVDPTITDTLSFSGDSLDYDCGQILEFAEARHHFYSLTIDGSTLTAEGYYDDHGQTNSPAFDSFILTNNNATDCSATSGDPGGGDPGGGDGDGRGPAGDGQNLTGACNAAGGAPPFGAAAVLMLLLAGASLVRKRTR